jgi:CRP-like cAMP-binding protein
MPGDAILPAPPARGVRRLFLACLPDKITVCEQGHFRRETQPDGALPCRFSLAQAGNRYRSRENLWMDEQTKFDILRKSPLTANMTDAQCWVLVGLLEHQILGNEEVLIKEGNIDNSFHVIVKGNLAVTKDTGAGDWTTLHILRTGDLAGELGFIDGRPHSATLRSVGETTVFSFARDKLEEVLEKDPWVVYRLMQTIVQAVHDILRRMNNQYVDMTNYITKQHGRY